MLASTDVELFSIGNNHLTSFAAIRTLGLVQFRLRFLHVLQQKPQSNFLDMSTVTF